MYAFWLVLTYDLLKDRRIDGRIDAIQVAVHLWSITEQMHGNLGSIC